MLERLQIRDYALIEQVTLELSPGLNILTGETGAGKSILIGALNLLLGQKGESAAIRSGAEESVVTAVLSLPENNSELAAWLAEKGIEPDEGNTLIIRRIVRRNGRGSTYLQSDPIPMKDLQYLTGALFEIHGQHEHQRILHQQQQRVLLDSYGALEGTLNCYRSSHRELSQLTKSLQERADTERKMLREKEMLEYAVEEIGAASVTPDEEEELRSRLKVMSNAEQLSEHLQAALNLLQNEMGSAAIRMLKQAEKELDAASAIDTELQENAARVESVRLELEDIHSTLRDYRERIDFSPAHIDDIHSRLQLIRNLKRKYGDTLSDVLEFFASAQQSLAELDQSFDNRERLERLVKEKERELADMAKQISAQRRRTADELSGRVNTHLHQLGMPNARFVITVTAGEISGSMLDYPNHGLDRIAYEIATNRGEPLKPLRDIASGGELSRIMLALKTVFSEKDLVSTMIFDEIDSGIGGSVAAAVGRHLADLSNAKQILCITHIASIAALADRHILVSKHEEQGRTVTEVRRLGEEAREREIARMLSGDETVESALQHARDLLQQ